jgi:hypothetical protein
MHQKDGYKMYTNSICLVKREFDFGEKPSKY